MMDMMLEALKARALIMFGGLGGQPIASGITADAPTAESPSFGLVRGAVEVIFSALLPGALFHANQACSRSWTTLFSAADAGSHPSTRLLDSNRSRIHRPVPQ